MNRFFTFLGKRLALYLNAPRQDYAGFSVASTEVLRQHLQPGDVVLVEGNTRISTAIKYLTQSTWSHAAIYVGDAGPKGLPLVEADLVAGVIAVPLEKYARLNVRICRPINLGETGRMKVVEFVLAQLGNHYDLKNVFDLMRYLLPTPPVPERFRRQLITFGSGDPTRAICSTLIAQAFQSIRYPILPRCSSDSEGSTDDIMTCSLETIHYSHFVPRDFDLSPYFEVVKFLARQEFDYTRLVWVDDFGNSAK